VKQLKFGETIACFAFCHIFEKNILLKIETSIHSLACSLFLEIMQNNMKLWKQAQQEIRQH
jgi:hypothetical protein